MPAPLSLFDLVAPYLLLGNDMGGITAALTSLFVEHWTVEESATGSVIRGRVDLAQARLVYTPPLTLTVIPAAGGSATPDASRDDWFDVRDAHIDFTLHVPREASAVLIAAAGLAPAAPAATATLFGRLDDAPGDPPPSDYPDSGFTLDLLLTTVVLRPPMLFPAQLVDGVLRPDPAFSSVEFSLPKLKLRLAQASAPPPGSPAGSGVPLTLDLVSLGASGLDDPGDIGVADLVGMTPPYTLWGDQGVFGFGFRGAVLDLADGATPAAVLAQFGFDEAWKGLYLPEVRLYFAPSGLDGMAVSGVASNLLIGFGSSSGVSGDFGISVVEQGEGPLVVFARFSSTVRPHPYGIVYTDDAHVKAKTAIPGKSLMAIDVLGGRPPYSASVDGVDQPTRTAEIEPPAAGATKTVTITVNDGSTPPRTGKLELIVEKLATTSATVTLPGAAPPGGPIPDPTVTTDSPTDKSLEFRLRSPTPTGVEVTLLPQSPTTTWTVDGVVQPAPSTAITVLAGAGANVKIAAERPDSGEKSEPDIFYHFDHPTDEEEALGYAEDPQNTRATEAIDALPQGSWTSQRYIRDELKARLTALPAGTHLQIDGYASYEGDPSALKEKYNQLLSDRRARGAAQLIESLYPGKFLFLPPPAGQGFAASKLERETAQANSLPPPPRNRWWKAIVQLPAVATPGPKATGTILRGTPAAPGATPPQTQVYPPQDPPAAGEPPPPDWFRSAALKIRLVEDQLVAVELDAEIDIQTGLKSRMNSLDLDPPTLRRLGANPKDGITRLRQIVQRDPGTGTIRADTLVGADPADRDGLLMTGWLLPEDIEDPTTGRQFLGLMTAFLPLLANVPSPKPSSGALTDLTEMTAVVGVPLALAQFDGFPIKVERVILHGIELMFEDRADGTQAAFLFDMEVALSAALPSASSWLVRVPRDRPLSVRYKAVGVRGGRAPGETGFRLRPVFDASRGYTIDASAPGTIEVRNGLDKILKVLGARIARTNPLNLEIDLGMSVDLGVVTVDRARIRLPMRDPPELPGPPELTALGVTVDVPGVLLGRGELEINDQGLTGALDLSLRPIGLRIRGDLSIEHVGEGANQAVAVFVGLEVDFPVPIPLWSTGLGIYGFLGLFAMHHRRKTGQGEGAQEVLSWLDQYKGQVNDHDAWTPELGRWAFGIGAVLGTLDGGILFNLKGALLLELPGPNILLTMRARLLAPRPGLVDENAIPGVLEALAVIDIDVDAGQLSIGILVDYEVKWLMKLHVPVNAFFNTHDTSNWEINLGKYPDKERVQAKVLNAFDGNGYLMLSGHGLTAGEKSIPSGFAVAAGLHIAFLWGSEENGLYAKVGGGFDALVGFDPFYFTAKLTLDGELRLFIVSIGAHAALDVTVAEVDGGHSAKVHGEICGRVEFLFFDVEGCVDFDFGADNVPGWSAPPLVTDFALMSRSPALVAGTAVTTPIDARVPVKAPPPGTLPIVPIDAIPVVMMRAPPGSCGKVLGGDPLNLPGGKSDGFVTMGDHEVRYDIVSVELTGADLDGAERPSVWWLPDSPLDANAGVQLALLTWTPTATPKAIETSNWLSQTVIDRWGSACRPPADPAPVLWTFLRQANGPRLTGWRLKDGIPQPDEAGTVRSAPPDVELRVQEAWRCGSAAIDALRGIEPAAVELRQVACPKLSPKKFNPYGLGHSSEAEELQQQLEIESGEILHAKAATSLLDTSRRLRAKSALSRGDMRGLAIGSLAGAGPYLGRPSKCYARLLGSPILDEGEAIAFGDPADAGKVQHGWEKAGFKPADLWDAIRVHVGPSQYSRFWLLVRGDLLRQERAVVRACRADGRTIFDRPISPEDIATPDRLPKTWLAMTSVWQRSIALVRQCVTPGYEQVIVQLGENKDLAWFEIGVLPQLDLSLRTRPAVGRPFYLGAVEALREGEVARAGYDDQQLKTDQKVLESALGLQSNAHAFLKPNSTYAIEVAWTAMLPGDKAPGETQHSKYSFRTDGTPPASLKPWLVASSPAEGEAHVFGGEKVSMVFATDDVARMWKLYGCTLRARLKAASFRQPEGDGEHPIPLDGNLAGVPGSIVSPWEAEIVKQASSGVLGCLDLDVLASRNAELKVPFVLDPFTDYQLVIESVADAAPPGQQPAVGIALSIGFSTSAYARAADFATAFAAAPVEHRHVAAGVLQAWATGLIGGSAFGTEMEEAFEKAGLDAMPLPARPRLVVLWEDAPDGLAQPAAILIDAPEAVWRSRPMPRPYTDPETTVSRITMQPVEWLKPVVTNGAAVSAIVAGPGGQRALIALASAQRGATVGLGLHHLRLAEGSPDGSGTPEETLAIGDLWLSRAPWEDDQP